MRYKFKDLYDIHPNKWVLTINEDEDAFGSIDTCEIHGVYDTKRELIILLSCKTNRLYFKTDTILPFIISQSRTRCTCHSEFGIIFLQMSVT